MSNTMNITALYESVCKVRPDAAVEKLFRANDGQDEWWFRDDERGCGFAELADDEAAAIIESRWMDLLPSGGRMCRSDEDETWQVVVPRFASDEDPTHGMTCDVSGWLPTRLEALAAYLIATAK